MFSDLQILFKKHGNEDKTFSKNMGWFMEIVATLRMSSSQIGSVTPL